MDHLEILKRSFSILLKNKYLWFLGLFAGGGIGSFSCYNINSSDLKDNFKVTGTDVTASAKAAGKILSDSVSNNIHLSNPFWVFVSVLILILVLLLIYVSIVSRGAIIVATDELDKEKNFGLKDSWKFGHRFFWRRLSFGLIIFLVVVLVLSVLTFPVILLAIFEHTILAIIAGIILGFIAVAFLIYLSLIIPIAERVLFLERVAISKSFFRGSDIFRGNWLNYILLYLVLSGINIIITIGLVFVLVVIALIVFAISVLLLFLSPIFSAVTAGILVFCAALALLAFVGAKQAFSSTVLTLGYKATIRNKR